MTGRNLLLAFAAWGFAVTLSGCQCYLGRYAVEREYVPSQCDDQWDPVLGSCHQCGQCGGNCPGFTPAMYMKHMKTCAAGGGEIYWNEWISDPPDECDPCGNCGEWVGPRCCPPKLGEQLQMGLMGARCDLCGVEGGCQHAGWDGSSVEAEVGEGVLDRTMDMDLESPSPSQSSPRSRQPKPARRPPVPEQEGEPRLESEPAPAGPIPNAASASSVSPLLPNSRSRQSGFRAISVRQNSAPR